MCKTIHNVITTNTIRDHHALNNMHQRPSIVQLLTTLDEKVEIRFVYIYRFVPSCNPTTILWVQRVGLHNVLILH